MWELNVVFMKRQINPSLLNSVLLTVKFICSSSYPQITMYAQLKEPF